MQPKLSQAFFKKHQLRADLETHRMASTSEKARPGGQRGLMGLLCFEASSCLSWSELYFWPRMSEDGRGTRRGPAIMTWSQTRTKISKWEYGQCSASTEGRPLKRTKANENRLQLLFFLPTSTPTNKLRAVAVGAVAIAGLRLGKLVISGGLSRLLKS